MVLLILKFAQIQAIRPVNDEHGWQCQQYRLPAHSLRQPAEERSNCSTSKVIRQGPEIAVSPDFLQLLVFRECNDRCNRKGIEQEVDSRGKHQQESGVWMQPRMQWSVINEVSRGNSNGCAGDVE